MNTFNGSKKVKNKEFFNRRANILHVTFCGRTGVQKENPEPTEREWGWFRSLYVCGFKKCNKIIRKKKLISSHKKSGEGNWFADSLFIYFYYRLRDSEEKIINEWV